MKIYKYFIQLKHGPNHLKVVEEFGYEMHLHCGAIRKVLLAYQKPSFIEEYFQNILENSFGLEYNNYSKKHIF